MDGARVQEVQQQIKEALMDSREKLGLVVSRDRELISDDMSTHQPEVVDVAQALEELDRSNTIAEQDHRKIAAIDHALMKISQGNFGKCEDCEEQIPEKRLLAVPEARFCARCQATEERVTSRSAKGLPATESMR